VLAHRRRSAITECVEDANGVSLAGESADVGLVCPVEGGYLVVRGQLAAHDRAAEDQGDDAAGHVLVDASEGVGLNLEPCLLADLAAQPVVDSLVEFQDAAGGFPVLVVAAADKQDSAVVVGNDTADADGVAGVFTKVA